MRSVAVALTRVFEMEVSAVRNSRWGLERPAGRPTTGASSLGFAFLKFASALLTTGGGLQVVLVDTFGRLGLAFAFPFSFPLGFLGKAELLEHDPFIDLTGPEKLILLHLFQRVLESSPIGHQLAHLAPCIPLCPQEGSLRGRWFPTSNLRSVEPANMHMRRLFLNTVCILSSCLRVCGLGLSSSSSSFSKPSMVNFL